MKGIIEFGKTKVEKVKTKIQKLDIEIARQMARVDESSLTVIARRSELNALIHDRIRALTLMESAHTDKLTELIDFEEEKSKLISELTEVTKKKIAV